MFKVVPTQDVQLKEYWCADLLVAKTVAAELCERYDCDCNIVNVPERRTWCSLTCALGMAFTPPRRLTPIDIRDDLQFACTQSELEDAVSHSKSDVLKINDHKEIFCFAATETFWQSRYASSLRG